MIAEFDPPGLQSHLNLSNVHGAACYRLNTSRFHVPDGVHVNFGRVRDLLLIHARQRAGGLQLIPGHERHF
jgi:hypothetical protein